MMITSRVRPLWSICWLISNGGRARSVIKVYSMIQLTGSRIATEQVLEFDPMEVVYMFPILMSILVLLGIRL